MYTSKIGDSGEFRRITVTTEIPMHFESPVFAFYTTDNNHIYAVMRLMSDWRTLLGSMQPNQRFILKMQVDHDDVREDTVWLDVVNSTRNAILNGIEHSLWTPGQEDAAVLKFYRTHGWELGDRSGFARSALMEDILLVMRNRFPTKREDIRLLEESIDQ